MTDKEFDLDKYRSIGHVGNKKSKTILMDQHGSTQTEHWDGRVDAHVQVPAIQLITNVKETQ